MPPRYTHTFRTDYDSEFKKLLLSTFIRADHPIITEEVPYRSTHDPFKSLQDLMWFPIKEGGLGYRPLADGCGARFDDFMLAFEHRPKCPSIGKANGTRRPITRRATRR